MLPRNARRKKMDESTRKALQRRLKEIRADRAADRRVQGEQKQEYVSSNGCAPCDFRTAANMIVGCYPDEKKGKIALKRFMQGEISFRELVEGMEITDESSTYIHAFVMEQFADAMDTYYTDWQ
jgi:hypothetical protein